jgi:hypothetical protein
MKLQVYGMDASRGFQGGVPAKSEKGQEYYGLLALHSLTFVLAKLTTTFARRNSGVDLINCLLDKVEGLYPMTAFVGFSFIKVIPGAGQCRKGGLHMRLVRGTDGRVIVSLSKRHTCLDLIDCLLSQIGRGGAMATLVSQRCCQLSLRRIQVSQGCFHVWLIRHCGLGYGKHCQNN